MHLWLKLYLNRPTFDAVQLDALQAVINDLLPTWSHELQVANEQSDENPTVVGRGNRLYDCVHRVAPIRHRLSDVTLHGNDEHIAFYMSHFNAALPCVSNRLSLEIVEHASVEGQPAGVWLRQMFGTLVAKLPIRYGNAHDDEEFGAKSVST